MPLSYLEQNVTKIAFELLLPVYVNNSRPTGKNYILPALNTWKLVVAVKLQPNKMVL